LIRGHSSMSFALLGSWTGEKFCSEICEKLSRMKIITQSIEIIIFTKVNRDYYCNF